MRKSFKKIGHRKVLIREFENLTDFLNFAENKKLKQCPKDIRSSEGIYRPEWHGTPNLGAALLLAKNGWLEGYRSLAKATNDIQVDLPTLAQEMQIRFAQTGDEVDVGRFLDNEPEHFVSFPTEDKNPQTGRILRLGIQVSFASNTTISSLLLRSAAICLLVDILEMLNYRLEVDVISSSSMGDNCGCLYRIPVKTAMQPLNRSKIAFTCCHRSMLRRIIFAAKENEEFAFGQWGSSTYGSSDTFFEADLYDISVWGTKREFMRFADTKRALEYVMSKLSGIQAISPTRTSD